MVSTDAHSDEQGSSTSSPSTSTIIHEHTDFRSTGACAYLWNRQLNGQTLVDALAYQAQVEAVSMGMTKGIEGGTNSAFQDGLSKSLAPIESAAGERVHSLTMRSPIS